MNFDLTDDQRLLQDSLARLTAGPVTEQAAAELGLNMLPFADADGGLGLGPVEMMLVGEAFGRAMATIPFLAGPVIAGTVLRLAPCSPARTEAIDAMLAGERRFAFVDDPSLVLGGDSADVFIVTDGDRMALVDAGEVMRRSFMLHNGWGAAEVDLGSAHGMALGELPDIRARVQQAAIGWLAAYATGLMAAAYDATVEHLKMRQQFGRPIGSNQALQHRVADMVVELEAARSMAIYATQAVREADAAERVRAFAAIKLVINQSAGFIGQQAVQLHGGIGVTQDCAVGRLFKHLVVVELLFGDSDYHAEILARAGGFTSAQPHWDAVSA